MNIKDTYIHEGPGGTNAKALLKDFSITSTLIVLTRAKLTADGSADETDDPITIPTWNLSTTGNAATATKLALSITLSLTGSVTGSASFDGSGNFSIATTTNHNHDSSYVKKYSYTIPTNGGVRISYSTDNPVLISVCGSNSGALLMLIGLGYGAGGRIRNQFTELVSCSMFDWCIPNSESISCSVEILSRREGNSTVYVLSTGNITFTAITALTSTKENATLLTSSNYTTWVYAKSSVYTKTESDARFVLKAGDTMTGTLTVPSLSVTGAATFSQAINGSILGNAATASRLQNARTISLTGSVTGSGTFDGSGNLSIATTTNHNHNSAYMTACALFTGASAATSATASLSNGSVYLNATKTINGTATNVGSIKISGSTGISVTTDTNGYITVTGTTSYLRVGATGATANVTSATSNPYLALVEGTTQSSQVQLLASTGISISANNGVITFTNTSTNSHTYTSTWTAKTDNVNYPIAFSPNATPATSGNGYNTGFTFNPGTKTFNNNGCRLQYDATNKVLKFIFD